MTRPVSRTAAPRRALRRRSAPRALACAACVLAIGSLACTQEPQVVPSAEEVEALYASTSRLSVEMSGNVAEVTVVQDAQQLRRGGSLWARVGPYIYLFSDATRDAFVQYNGLAAVRVITVAPGGTEVARATLLRGTLNELTWRRALNISGLARRDGTEQLTLLEDLVRWGEDRSEFEYNPRYQR
ncbi:MAG TPA: hypothetical protein VK858_13730 [Longimicrobiales bacterium]|nr:hypothetical protein [Longimicrobiales bacterium]